jgi:hypothetical protein
MEIRKTRGMPYFLYFVVFNVLEKLLLIYGVHETLLMFHEILCRTDPIEFWPVSFYSYIHTPHIHTYIQIYTYTHLQKYRNIEMHIYTHINI